MLDGKDEDSNSNQDSAVPYVLHGKISDDNWQMMDQQFAHPTHASEGEDFKGLEDTLKEVLRRLGDTRLLTLRPRKSRYLSLVTKTVPCMILFCGHR
jgi:hypothetical protein